MIDDLYISGWSVEEPTETRVNNHPNKSWATKSGLSNIEAHFRQFTSAEIAEHGKEEGVQNGYVYTAAVDTNGTAISITSKDRFKNPDGKIFNIVAPPNNPHDMDEFFQIEVKRDDVEKGDE